MPRRLFTVLALLTILAGCVTPTGDNSGITDRYLEAGLDAHLIGNYQTAFRVLKPLAEQGDAVAQLYLGIMYAKGQEVNQNYEIATKWFTKAADKGHAEAQNYLGAMYEDGLGVQQDYKRAIFWYFKAAGKNVTHAQARIGVFYEKAIIVPRDFKLAAYWYKLAADKGSAHAQFRLGFFYEKGFGVSQDYTTALRWYKRAATQGNKLAKIWRQDLVQKLEAAKAKARPKAPRPNAKPVKKIARRFPTQPIKVKFPKTKPRPDDIAVIIGNANYKKLGRDIPNVTPAYADAAGFRNYVLSKGVRKGNIIDIKDATAGQMESVFGNSKYYKGQLFNWTKANVSKIYVYYAGHGAPAGDEGTAYLVPADASLGSVALTGYSLSLLYKNLAKIPATSITVVLESCFSGISHSGTLVPQSSGITVSARAPTVSPKITVISAGALNQIASWEKNSSHSLFTKYFLKAMSGEGDKKPYGNGNGKVSLNELNKYLGDTLTYYARRYYGRDQAAQIVNGGG